MFSLTNLANEIIIAIFDFIDDSSTLISLAQTCTALQPLAEAKHFETIYVRNGPQAQSLSVVLDERPELFKYIKELEATPSGGHCNVVGIELVPGLVRRMKNLCRLRVEAPRIKTGYPFDEFDRLWARGSGAKYMSMLREANSIVTDKAPLRNLRSRK